MQFVTACKQSWYKVSGRNFGRFCKSITTLLRTTAAKGIIATNNWYAKTLRFAKVYKQISIYVLALISENTMVAVSMKIFVNTFVRIFAEMFGPLVSSSCFQDATAVSFLIKYDYSVIELNNMIFRKAVEFFGYIT